MQTRSDQRLAFGVILLAAGRSRRMGRPKLLLPWGDTAVLGRLLEQWSVTPGAYIAVVGAADDTPLQSELDRLDFPKEQRIFNPDPDRGMFSSIQCAAGWAHWPETLSHWLITLGDQPQLQPQTLRQLMEFASAHPEKISQPLRGGHRRHPVVLPRRVFLELKTSGAPDLKAFLTAHAEALAGFESDDAGLDLDLDTPEDYERLRPGNGP